MEIFYINNIQWKVYYVSSNSHFLIDRTGTKCIATTDVKRKNIFIECNLSGEILKKALLHEITHAAMDSYGLLEDIHKMISHKNWFFFEEWICNFIFDYGLEILEKVKCMPNKAHNELN